MTSRPARRKTVWTADVNALLFHVGIYRSIAAWETGRPAPLLGLLDVGAIPMVVDVFDAERLQRIMIAARPDTVVHQLADVPRNLDASRMEEGIRRNARIRAEARVTSCWRRKQRACGA